MPEIPLPDPPLDDGVVVLRRLDWADAPAIVAACSDPEIPRWTELPSPYTDRDAHEYLVRLEPDRRAGRALGFGVARYGEGALLASCGLTRFDWTERKTEPLLLVTQFVVCVATWTLVVLLIDGAVSDAGFVASVATGMVLVVVTWLLVKLGWLRSPERTRGQ